MSREDVESSTKTDEKSCKEHAEEEKVKTCSTTGTSTQREPHDKEYYSLTKEKRESPEEDEKVVYIISREDDVVKHCLDAEDAFHSEYHDEFCEIHAQQANASAQDTLDIIDECFSFATDIVSSAVDNCPDINLLPSILACCLKVVIYLKTNPKIASIITSLIILWWIWCQIDSYYSYVAAHIVNILNPCVHYITVTLEQIFRRSSQLSSSFQDVWESFYCDFSINWCQKFQLMCDVQCSHVHRTLERIRRTI